MRNYKKLNKELAFPSLRKLNRLLKWTEIPFQKKYVMYFCQASQQYKPDVSKQVYEIKIRSDDFKALDQKVKIYIKFNYSTVRVPDDKQHIYIYQVSEQMFDLEGDRLE